MEVLIIVEYGALVESTSLIESSQMEVRGHGDTHRSRSYSGGPSQGQSKRGSFSSRSSGNGGYSGFRTEASSNCGSSQSFNSKPRSSGGVSRGSVSHQQMAERPFSEGVSDVTSRELAIAIPTGDVLVANKVYIDSSVLVGEKKVVFRSPGQPEMTFYEECRVLPSYLILAMTAIRLLRKGCTGYLAHVIDTWDNTLRLEDISMVREFLEVSSEDLPGLPP
ncbi:hypothetical protein L3X38_017131 [Prunus dulcis]|uniref:Uncharacterized protein n=1 Tax=Prunus dulcis TaxID=3755 RepID=A0AAD4W6J7_PRUDU|nr:hypothetical protein L3X38_017131 [Prunus dulcis]